MCKSKNWNIEQNWNFNWSDPVGSISCATAASGKELFDMNMWIPKMASGINTPDNNTSIGAIIAHYWCSAFAMSNILWQLFSHTYLSLCLVLLSQEILNHFLSISNRVISFVSFGSLTNTNVFSIWYFAKRKLQFNTKPIGMCASQARIEKLFMKNEITQKVNKIYLWLGTHSYYPHTHTASRVCVCHMETR